MANHLSNLHCVVVFSWWWWYRYVNVMVVVVAMGWFLPLPGTDTVLALQQLAVWWCVLVVVVDVRMLL